MTLYNALSAEQELSRDAFMIFLQLLAPFAPHIAEELWEQHGGTYSIHTSSWPIFDETALVEDEVVVVVQINGKTRADLRISKDVIGDREGIEKLARGHSRVLPHLESKKVKKVIYIQGKILNFVV